MAVWMTHKVCSFACFHPRLGACWKQAAGAAVQFSIREGDRELYIATYLETKGISAPFAAARKPFPLHSPQPVRGFCSVSQPIPPFHTFIRSQSRRMMQRSLMIDARGRRRR